MDYHGPMAPPPPRQALQPGDPRLSVIIPTLDEAATLPLLLGQLAEQRGTPLEVIVADGGSTDGTVALAAAAGARVVHSTTGRGRQMNRGVTVSRGEFLLFLHADSGLTGERQLAKALDTLIRRLENTGHHRVAGHFRLHFQHTASAKDSPYRYYEEKSALNRRECTNGDQGFLMPRAFFAELGGFDESLWFLEDQRLAETIRSRGEWITLPGTLETSARRFEREGLLRRMILSALIMNFHHIGLHAFFHRAGSVYRNQEATGRLQLAPVFELIQQLNREAGPATARRRWLATGRYVAGNAWQPCFWLDLKLYPLTRGRRPFLWLHDRLLGPLLQLAPFGWVAAGLTWLWFQACRRHYRRVDAPTER